MRGPSWTTLVLCAACLAPPSACSRHAPGGDAPASESAQAAGEPGAAAPVLGPPTASEVARSHAASARSAPGPSVATVAASADLRLRLDGAAPSSAAASCAPTPPYGCILQAWMKANAGPAIMSRDIDVLDAVLTQIAAFAPHGYDHWASIARDGADAARAGEIDAVKAACRSCHSQYRARYKMELHDRRL